MLILLIKFVFIFTKNKLDKVFIYFFEFLLIYALEKILFVQCF